MTRLSAFLSLPLLFAPATSVAQGGMSQARLEGDCLGRLEYLVPRDVKVAGVGFYALGNYATYYVVTYRFTGALDNGSRTAACTYRRDGQWVRDDAAAHKAAQALESARGGARAHGSGR